MNTLGARVHGASSRAAFAHKASHTAGLNARLFLSSIIAVVFHWVPLVTLRHCGVGCSSKEDRLFARETRPM